jgi:hypothetical protein
MVSPTPKPKTLLDEPETGFVSAVRRFQNRDPSKSVLSLALTSQIHRSRFFAFCAVTGLVSLASAFEQSMMEEDLPPAKVDGRSMVT